MRRGRFAVYAVVCGLALLATACHRNRPASDGNVTTQAPVPQHRQLVVASFGGEWQKAQRLAMMQPFAKREGIEIVEVEYKGEYSLLKEKGASGEWDVVDVEPVEMLRGGREGILEKIDYSPIDRQALLPSAVNPYGVGLCTYTVALGFNSTHKSPANWRDFFDLQGFPGKRAFHNSPQWMLEFALLGDGVEPSKLYPLDMNRAFRALDRIRSQLVTFETWSQPAEMLAKGDVVMSPGSNGRLAAATAEGKPVAMIWKGGILGSDYFVIPAGSKNKELAQRFVAYSVSKEAQAEMTKHILYGPTNKSALALVPAERRKQLPSSPDNLAQQVVFGPGWWLEHKEEATQRYNEWLLSKPSK